MTKFRRNHQTRGRSHTQGFVFRSILYVIFILIVLFVLFKFIKSVQGSIYDSFETPDSVDALFYLPDGSNGQVIDHGYYQLAYNEKREQADWVAYVLKREELKMPNVKRSRKYFSDPEVWGKSAHHKDYSNSGYTRGHLAPAGDMAHTEDAMRTSFYMSNMTPQLRAFNNGIWKELEESARDWAFKNNELIIITGPIFDTNYPKQIGRANVAVPDRFFKIILDIEKPDYKAIAFVIPNESSEQLLQEYAVTIDEVENLTGFDFFNDLLDDEEEEALESKFDLQKWSFSDKRYNLRITKWNQS